MEKHDGEFDGLLAVVGPERRSHTPEEVAAAEKRLRELVGVEEEATLRGMRQNGYLAAGIGVVLLLIFLFCPAEYAGDVRLRIMYSSRVPWSYYVDTILVRLTWELCLPSGILLICSGLAFFGARDWARRVIAAVITFHLLFCAAALVIMDAGSVRNTEWTRETILWAAIRNVSLGALIWGLWRARRYFLSERIRQACGASRSASDEAKR